ncbi:hypothetical protein NQ314_020653 [Rhamnusium bicolor]|uniref:Clip domain-containing protein n=1 Tax=Rhamnusium bicolor TaxID=1586634 RepID=A0AAV8WJR5_9CUCU|nr:hypothetical protein NQ314_020653 [Rhamnusium bicolor]
MQLLLTQSSNPTVKTYLRSSTCGYIGSTPMVCCPQARAKNPSTLIDAVSDGDDLSDEDSSSDKRNAKEIKLLSPPWLRFQQSVKY